MIAIINVDSDPRPTGPHTYQVQINTQAPLARFTHNREDGLAVCLEKAAEAVRAQEASSRIDQDFWNDVLNRR